MPSIGGQVPTSDHQCGFYEIPDSVVATIEQGKQSVTFGQLQLDGQFNVDGQLIIEV